MRSALSVAVALALFPAVAAAQSTTYTYVGDPYTTATAPYALGGQLTGSITVANPLPPFQPLTDITPSLTAMSFNDTVETRTLADSFLCGGFEVATDGAGNITQWQIRLRRSPSNPGDPHHAIDSSGAPGVVGGIDLVGTGTAPADACGPMVLSPNASTSSQGTWADSNPLPSQPTTYTYTGDPYTSATAPYALGGQLTGSITVANPLPPFLPLTDISAALAAMSFNDTVETRTLADSFLCGGFEVATDGAGNITSWQVHLRRSPSAPGNPHHSIDSTGDPGVTEESDLVGTGIAPVDPCGPMVLSPSASTSSEGTWTDTNPLPSQPTIYNYTGDPYTAATAPYALGGQLSGSITVANPLPPLLPMTDITAALTAMSFNDTVETRTLADSFLCGFEVSTDAAGNITGWQVHLRRSPSTPGNPHHSVDSTGDPGVAERNDLVGTGIAPVDPCGVMVLSPSASNGSEGTWIRGQSVVEVPALDGIALVLLGGLLALSGLTILTRWRP